MKTVETETETLRVPFEESEVIFQMEEMSSKLLTLTEHHHPRTQDFQV